MDKKQTVQWIITAALRLLAGYFAVKFGKDAVGEQTWASLGEGIAAVVIAGISIFTSVKARSKLQAAPPPTAPHTGAHL